MDKPKIDPSVAARMYEGFAVRIPLAIETGAPLSAEDAERFRVRLQALGEAIPNDEDWHLNFDEALRKVQKEFGITTPSKFGTPYVIDESARIECEDAWPRWARWSYEHTGLHMYAKVCGYDDEEAEGFWDEWRRGHTHGTFDPLRHEAPPWEVFPDWFANPLTWCVAPMSESCTAP